jgi:hypothetical protein
MSRSILIAFALLGLLGIVRGVSAQDKEGSDALEKDAQALQGQWQRVSTTDKSVLGKAKRAVKEIKGDKETVTWYDEKDMIIRSHRVTFKLSESGRVRVFTWSDLEFLDQTGKWQKAAVRGSYVYRIEKGVLCESSGFLQDQQPFFEFVHWKKAEDKK